MNILVHINSKSPKSSGYTVSEGIVKRDTHIRRVTDEFTEKDLFVAVEGVDDKTQQLVDLSLESKRLLLRHFSVIYEAYWRRRKKTERRFEE